MNIETSTESHGLGNWICLGTTNEVALFHQLNAYVKQNNNDINALIKLGALCSSVFESPDEASRFLKRAIKIDPDNFEAYYWLGRTNLIDGGGGIEAKNGFEGTLRIDDKNQECQSKATAAAITVIGSPQKTIKEVLQNINKQPTWVSNYAILSYLLLLDNDFEGAREVLKRTGEIEQYLERKRCYTKLTEKYYIVYNFYPFSEIYDELKKREEEYNKSTNKKDLETKIKRAKLNFPILPKRFTKPAKPVDPEIDLLKGRIGDVERYNYLQKQLQTNPNDINALIEFGALCSVAFECCIKAKFALERAIKLDPINLEAQYWLGWTRVNLTTDSYDKIKLMLEKSLEYNSYFYIEFQKLYDHIIKRIHMHYGVIKKIKSIDNIIERYPQFIWSYSQICKDFVRSGYFIDAKQLITKIRIMQDSLKYFKFSKSTQGLFSRANKDDSSNREFLTLHNFLYQIKNGRLSILEKLRILLKKIFFSKQYNSKFEGFKFDITHGTKAEIKRFYKLREHLDLNQNDQDALLEFGVLCSVVFGGAQEAGNALNHLLKLNPKHIEAHFWLARMHIYERGDFEIAQRILEKALKIDITNNECQNLLTRALEYQYRGNYGFYKDELEKKIRGNILAFYIEYAHVLIYKSYYDSVHIRNAKKTLQIARKLSRTFKPMKFNPKTKEYHNKFLAEQFHDWLGKLETDIKYRMSQINYE